MNNKVVLRLLNVILIVTLAWIVFVSGAVAILYQKNKEQLATNKKQLTAVCESANHLRASEKDFWQGLLNSPSPRQLTPEEQQQQQATKDLIQKNLDKSFAPQDCTN